MTGRDRINEILISKGLTKRFGGLAAIEEIDLNVTRGSTVGIIGPNGSGKTTLFNVITGYLKTTSGEVFFEGKKVTGLKPHEIVNMGVVRTFQVPQCCKSLTIRENIRLACLGRYDDDRIEEKTRMFARLAKLDSLYDTISENVPIGYLRKIEFAMAMATDPKLILLDEPFSGLTDLECEELSMLIQGLYEKTTIVIIDHKLKHLMPIVEKVIVLNQGRMFFEGTPTEVSANSDVQKIYIGGEVH
jgi:branched-chain amino acid transport system ATP-binding protein